MINKLKQFLKDESGATAIEYGLIAVLIAIFLIAGATQMGQSLNTSFNSVNNGLAAGTR